MESIKKLYKIGHGPSSSHTMGPLKAAQEFGARHRDAASFNVTLYGALAGTGKGHMTDVAIVGELEKTAPTEIIWKPEIFLPFHPNGMTFVALDARGNEMDRQTVYSIGGGDIVHEGEERPRVQDVYPMNTIAEILDWTDRTGKSFWEYVEEHEDPDVWDYLREVWRVMKEAVERGIDAEECSPADSVYAARPSATISTPRATTIRSAAADWSMPTRSPSARKTRRAA